MFTREQSLKLCTLQHALHSASILMCTIWKCVLYLQATKFIILFESIKYLIIYIICWKFSKMIYQAKKQWFSCTV